MRYSSLEVEQAAEEPDSYRLNLHPGSALIFLSQGGLGMAGREEDSIYAGCSGGWWLSLQVNPGDSALGRAHTEMASSKVIALLLGFPHAQQSPHPQSLPPPKVGYTHPLTSRLA